MSKKSQGPVHIVIVGWLLLLILPPTPAPGPSAHRRHGAQVEQPISELAKELLWDVSRGVARLRCCSPNMFASTYECLYEGFRGRTLVGAEAIMLVQPSDTRTLPIGMALMKAPSVI